MWSFRSSVLRRAVLAVAVIAALASVSPRARGQAVPAPSTAVASPAPTPAAPRVRSVLVPGGASLFALTYIASAYSATTSYESDSSKTTSRTAMWVPLVGPFVTLGSTRAAGSALLLVLDGLAQAGGLSLFVYGILSSPPPAAAPRDRPSPVTLSLEPMMVDRRSGGAGVVGTF
jgi:hypothetical protein